MSAPSYVRVEREGAVARLILDRPEKLNALSAEVLEHFGRALDEVDAMQGLRALVVTGAGKAFVAGADIAAMQQMGADQARHFSAAGHALFARLEAMPVAVIAAVNGFALGGGCELALACDFIYASERARFGQPEVKLGVIPGFGGTQRLARRVGVAMARELVFTGRMLKADEALRIGLVNAVAAAEELMPRVMGVAEEIAGVGPLALAAAKRVIAEGEGEPLAVANAREVEAFAGCFESADQKEGMAAFLGKRAPDFQGA
ncbi:MAG: hypothetical protein GXP55_00560 [Deltaproteobacteria bacterium]|nr:hypothetical protein [Deltaproteobacteria bacterium]